jgi:hypothetical protein
VKYVCDAPDGRTWFRLETEAEAAAESQLMNHAVEKHFREAQARAATTFVPASARYIEQEIGRKAHIQREMPLFLTLRDHEGEALVTAMLPPRGAPDPAFRCIVVGQANADPYPAHGDAVEALGRHFSFELPRARCYPYRRG